MTFKQLFCIHWFDAKGHEQYGVSEGPIICTEQKGFMITEQVRQCSKCKLIDKRVIHRECLGWN